MQMRVCVQSEGPGSCLGRDEPSVCWSSDGGGGGDDGGDVPMEGRNSARPSNLLQNGWSSDSDSDLWGWASA